MRSINMVILIGNVASAPELHETKNGKKLCHFALAINRTWNDTSGETAREVDFHKIVVWGKLAELSEQYLAKGKKVYISGKIMTNAYESNGEKKYSTEIHADQIEFLTPKTKEEKTKELTTA